MTKDWQRVLLKDASDVFTDGDWIETKDQSPDGIRLVQTGNIGFGFFKNKKDKARFVSEETFTRLNCTEILPGDLLVSRLPDPVGKSCIIPDLNTKMITGVDCTIIRPKDFLTSKYLAYYQQSNEYLKQVTSRVTGTTRSRISRKNLGMIEIPIPPLPEQHQIVAILDQAFEAIDQAKANIERNIENVKELFQAKLDQIFSKQDEGWKFDKLGGVMDIARGGSPRPIKKYLTDSPDGINWIKISDATASGKYIYSTKQKISKDGLHKTRMVEEGDFLLSNSMSFGRPYIMKTKGCIHDGWLVLKEKDNLHMNKDFLYHLLGSPYIFKQFDSLAAGSTVRNLNIALVSSVEIPIPPLNEQEMMVRELDQISNHVQELVERYQAKLDRLKELKKSILQKAFAGELTGKEVEV